MDFLQSFFELLTGWDFLYIHSEFLRMVSFRVPAYEAPENPYCRAIEPIYSLFFQC